MTTDQGITALVINPSENMIKNNINFTSGFSRSYSEIKSVRLKKNATVDRPGEQTVKLL